MKKKINFRLSGIAILAIFATVIGITIVYYGLFQRQIRADLAVSAKLLRDTHYFESTSINPKSINLSTDKKELRVTWVDKDGTVLYDNDVSANKMSNHMDRPEIKEAFDSGKGETVRKSDTLNEDTFYYALLLDNGTVLRVAANAQSLFSVFMSVAPIIAFIILFIIAICVALSHILTRQLLVPIEVMIENLENADYESPYRELDPLAEKFRSQHADVLAAAKARQDFTANVSHELKTPLTAISGYAELLEGGIADKDQKNHFYHEIRRNADRLLSLINDIIRLSELDHREQDLLIDKVDLKAIVKECLGGLITIAKQRDIELVYEGESLLVNGNKELLKELIENLVQNAIRYNNPGGKVTISTQKKDGESLLIVKDNGIGIPTSEQDRIFERFYRVDKSRSKETGGTGLGLAIVKHILELHDARIIVDSALGVGTTMTVIF